jgi:hypothetical protein
MSHYAWLLLTQRQRKMERALRAGGTGSKMCLGDQGRVMGDDRELIALGSAPTTQIPVQAGRVAQA